MDLFIGHLTMRDCSDQTSSYHALVQEIPPGEIPGNQVTGRRTNRMKWADLASQLRQNTVSTP